MEKTADKASSFARAFFALTNDKEKIREYYSQVVSLDTLNNTNSDLSKILSARSIDKQDRKELVKNILTACGFDQKVIFWIWTIIDYNFYRYFHEVFINCKKRYENMFDIIPITITSANNMSEAQMNKIKKFFEQKLKKEVSITWNVNPDLIGDLTIQLNNKTYNNTYRMKLNNLKQQLLSKRG